MYCTILCPHKQPSRLTNMNVELGNMITYSIHIMYTVAVTECDAPLTAASISNMLGCGFWSKTKFKETMVS